MNKSVKSVLCSRLFATLIIAAGSVCASTVKVSDFGFDPEDSTKFLQKALSSDARKIIIDKQSSPWVTRPLRLRRHNVEIVFEKGVELVAKKGAYHYYGDCLFRAHGIKNLRIIGNGATVRMQRADYLKAPYKRSEHRHGFDFSDVHGLYIENLNIVSTGGDAIYLGGSPDGACVDVTIRGVKTADNHRQGLSVISAENLLVADCIFETTVGTPPMDAIDFEPNRPGQRIVNCVVSNCVARGNLGFAWDVAVNHLDSKARPISVEFIDCVDEGNNGSLRIFCENRDFDNVKGTVKFRRCKFIRPRINTFSVTQNADHPVTIDFEGCSFTPRDADTSGDVPDWRKLCLSPEITGSDAVVKAQTDVDFSNAEVADLTPGEMATFSPMAIRYGCAYLFYADRAKTVRFRGVQTPIGRNVAPSDQPMRVLDMNGNAVASFPMPDFGEKEFEVAVPRAGFYRLEVVAQRSSYALTGCDVPVALDLYRGRRSMINSAGEFFINVAKGSLPLAVTAVGSASERLRIKLTDPSGTVAWDRDSIDRTCRHVLENPAVGVWKMQILKASKGAFEDYKIDLTGVPSHLFLSKEKTWRIPRATHREKERRDYPVAAGASIQAAIDSAFKAGGGRVVVRNGVHPSGTIRLKSDIELHLEKGAVILGGDKPADYDDIDDPRVGVAPERSHKVFIVCMDAKNVAITGEGTIDGRGVSFYDPVIKPPSRFFRKPPIPRPRMVQFFKVSDVRFEGVTFKDSPGWTFWLRDSEDIVFDRVKIVGDQRMINNDGIDFDGCRRMRVTDCDISTGDDCIVMRAIRGNSRSEVVCEDLFVSGCRLSSACQGVRLGCPSDDTIRNARFENCVFRGHNAIMSFHPYHYLASGDTGYCRMFGISFKDWKIESNACAITLAVEGGIRLRDFGNVSFSDMKIKSRLPLRLEGCAETMLKNVTFKNMDIEVLEGEPFKIKSVAGISFDSCSVKSGPGKASEFKESARGKGNAGSSWETDKKKR